MRHTLLALPAGLLAACSLLTDFGELTSATETARTEDASIPDATVESGVVIEHPVVDYCLGAAFCDIFERDDYRDGGSWDAATSFYREGELSLSTAQAYSPTRSLKVTLGAGSGAASALRTRLPLGREVKFRTMVLLEQQPNSLLLNQLAFQLPSERVVFLYFKVTGTALEVVEQEDAPNELYTVHGSTVMPFGRWVALELVVDYAQKPAKVRAKVDATEIAITNLVRDYTPAIGLLVYGGSGYANNPNAYTFYVDDVRAEVTPR